MNDGHELLRNMQQFSGAEQLFRHGLVRDFNYTEGVRFFAQNAGGGAYWLLDILATEPAIRSLVLDEREGCGFASVRLKVTGSKAHLIVDDGNGNTKFRRFVDPTDCPERPKTKLDPEGVWLFFIESSQLGDGKLCMTMMWPSER
ncbi:hypothetical protein GFK26_18325 [Variovorax paradoxus]|uniref:DUF6876 domain-containing protein n=1 Tax=Variovorax paradoxus TaxID=34073 RepID=A0A5Q0M7U7_VARPD|nr:DUF6876 family protein [Variovorax paradoxus]QFZ84585.1 hypothetical protein GFK26_18325 [Variovorax paradoxus]